jgi:molecular chaperone DnaK
MRTIGVDLGTTNTLAAADGQLLVSQSQPDDAGIVPSVVAFLPNGMLSVGEAARRRRPIDARNTVFSSKRVIGRAWHSYEASRFREHYPFELVRGPGDAVAFQTRAGLVSPAEIATEILVYTCRRAGVAPEQHRALITVPAQFGPDQRNATMEAGRNAGFADVAVLDEPVATAVAYLRARVADVRCAAVYDLGGGTFDLAILDCTRTPYHVLAHGGDAYLGGDDVDVALADWAAQQVLERHHWDLRSDPEVFARLLLEVERAKVRLSFAAETVLELGQVDPASPLATMSLTVRREALEHACHPLVGRTFGICDEVLARAALKPGDVSAVLLAGGSTGLPMVRRDVAAYFGQPPLVSFDPMEVVAIGASLAANG